jgi:hypothetical protein
VHGLCPSPRVELKFKPLSNDPINGNDFIYQSFVASSARCHRHLKAFFTVHDPLLIVQDRKTEPNWKVLPLLHRMNWIISWAMKLGDLISVDKQTIGFQV